MRYLEVRRHTERVKPGQHLSQRGVNIARRVGDTIGPFDRVITTSLPRALETAIAMGFAVDEVHDYFYSIDAEIAWDAGFAAWAQAYCNNGAVTRYCHELATYWRGLVASLPEDGAALLITHGGIVEAGAVGCLPHADYESMGGFCGYCEGVHLSFDGEQFVSVDVLRLTASADPA